MIESNIENESQGCNKAVINTNGKKKEILIWGYYFLMLHSGLAVPDEWFRQFPLEQ